MRHPLHLFSCALLAVLASSHSTAQEASFDFGAVAAETSRLAAAGAFDEAIARLEDAQPRLERQPLQRAWSRKYIGEMRRAQGRYEDALIEFDAAEAVLEELPDDSLPARRIIADLWTQRGRVDMDYGLLDRAAEDLRLAHEHLDALAKTGVEIRSETLGLDYADVTLYAAQEAWEQLLETRDQLLFGKREGLYRESPFHESRLHAKVGAGLFEMARLAPERIDECRATLEFALDFPELPLPDRTEPLFALAQLAMREGDWEAGEKALQLADEALGVPLARHEVPFAYGKSLGLRAMLTLERGDRTPIRKELEELHVLLERAFDKEIERWSTRPLRAGGYGFFAYNPIQILSSEWIRLTLTLDDKRGVERCLEKLVRAQAASTLVRRSGGGPHTVAAFRERWIGDDPGHLVLVWLPSADRSHLFALDHQGLLHHQLAPADQLERDRRALERSIATPLGADAPRWRVEERNQALLQMRDALLPPSVRTRLEASARVTIVGLDLLGEVPFEALPLGEEALGTQLAVAYLPTLPLGLVLHERGPSSTSIGEVRALLAGDVAPDEPLISTAAFAAMLAPYDGRSVLLRGSQADYQTLCDKAPDAEVLQLFTHGGRRRGRERPQAFRLASSKGPALFGAVEVEEGLESPELVLLTVCESARGRRRRGDAGAGELVGSFLLAERTRCVVATAFELDAHAAQRIAISFHSGLVDGVSPAEALRRARVELAADPDFADPSYHGLIRTVGLGHVPLFPR